MHAHYSRPMHFLCHRMTGLWNCLTHDIIFFLSSFNILSLQFQSPNKKRTTIYAKHRPRALNLPINYSQSMCIYYGHYKLPVVFTYKIRSMHINRYILLGPISRINKMHNYLQWSHFRLLFVVHFNATRSTAATTTSAASAIAIKWNAIISVYRFIHFWHFGWISLKRRVAISSSHYANLAGLNWFASSMWFYCWWWCFRCCLLYPPSLLNRVS